MDLIGKDRRALRALGHHLKPVVQIGQHGVTEALVKATVQALSDHELIKVRLLESAPIDRKEAAAQLSTGTGADVVQIVGRTLLLYKPHADEPKIKIGVPPKAALHGHVGGEGDRPAARVPKRAITQGAADEGAPGRSPRGAPAPSASSKQSAHRRGTGAALPPRRHRSD